MNGEARRRKLKRLQMNSEPSTSSSSAGLAREDEINGELACLYEKEERVWWQNSRESWLRHGDGNTRFFHTATIIRRKRNYIGSLVKEDGTRVSSRKDIRKHLNCKFFDLFSSSNPLSPDDLEGIIDPVLNKEDNQELERVSSDEEIKDTVWNMPSLKAPGPDGLQGCFYKKFWDVVGKSLCLFVQEFFEGKRVRP